MGTAGHSAVATGPEHRTPGGTDGARGPHRAGLRGRFPPALHAPCSEEPVRGQAGTRSYGHSTVPWVAGPAFTGLCAVPSAPVPFAPVGPGPTPKAQRLPEVFAVRQKAGVGKQTPVHCDGAATRGRLAICSGNRSRAEPGHRGTGDGGRLRSSAHSKCGQRGRGQGRELTAGDPHVATCARKAKAAALLGSRRRAAGASGLPPRLGGGPRSPRPCPHRLCAVAPPLTACSVAAGACRRRGGNGGS